MNHHRPRLAGSQLPKVPQATRLLWGFSSLLNFLSSASAVTSSASLRSFLLLARGELSIPYGSRLWLSVTLQAPLSTEINKEGLQRVSESRGGHLSYRKEKALKDRWAQGCPCELQITRPGCRAQESPNCISSTHVTQRFSAEGWHAEPR